MPRGRFPGRGFPAFPSFGRTGFLFSCLEVPFRCRAALSARLGASLLCAALVACSRAGNETSTVGGISVISDDSAVVHLERPARRIISLIPGRTDALLAMGAIDRIVARTRYDEDPRLATLPSLEDALTPSVEWLVEQRPDLVIAWADRQSRSVVTRLRELGIPVYASNIETIDEIRHGLRDLGVLAGLEPAADSILAGLDSVIARTRSIVAPLPRVRVMYLVGLDPPMASGPKTFIDEMIAIAGGTNVFGDAATRWPPVSLEEIVARQPDVLLIAVERPGEAVMEWLNAKPGLRALTAVRDGRVRVLSASEFNRPGPSLIHTIPLLLDAIHPGTAAHE